MGAPVRPASSATQAAAARIIVSWSFSQVWRLQPWLAPDGVHIHKCGPHELAAIAAQGVRFHCTYSPHCVAVVLSTPQL